MGKYINSIREISKPQNHRKGKKFMASLLPSTIRLPANVADPFFIDDANATPITTQYTLGEIYLAFLRLHRAPTSTAIIALGRRLSSTLGTENK
jgi:hypothetical protein